MANEEHIAILMRGVEVWNTWRKENQKVKPDLDHANQEKTNLVSANLSNTDLAFANLSEAKLCGANLKKAKLLGADLRRADLWNADLRSADLVGADLSGADLRGANFENADLSGANLCDACLYLAIFAKADLCGADLIGADLSGVNLSGTDVTSVRYLPKRRHNSAKSSRFIGSNVETCIGNLSFKRYVQDQAYLEEFHRDHPRWFQLWWITSRCGQSIGVWAMWALILALIFGFVFAGHPALSFVPSWMESILFFFSPDLTFSNPNPTGFTPYYFSIVTFTTLGFGDVTPNDLCGEIWVTLEVILGYVMLGGLISILANKLARRS